MARDRIDRLELAAEALRGARVEQQRRRAPPQRRRRHRAAASRRGAARSRPRLDRRRLRSSSSQSGLRPSAAARRRAPSTPVVAEESQQPPGAGGRASRWQRRRRPPGRVPLTPAVRMLRPNASASRERMTAPPSGRIGEDRGRGRRTRLPERGRPDRRRGQDPSRAPSGRRAPIVRGRCRLAPRRARRPRVSGERIRRPVPGAARLTSGRGRARGSAGRRRRGRRRADPPQRRKCGGSGVAADLLGVARARDDGADARAGRSPSAARTAPAGRSGSDDSSQLADRGQPDLERDAGERLADVEHLAVAVVVAVIVGRELVVCSS